MTDSLIALAGSFTLLCVFAILFSGLLAGISALLCLKFDWIKQWRGYWCVLILVCVIYGFLGLLPVQGLSFSAQFMADFTLNPAYNHGSGNAITGNSETTSAYSLHWTEVLSLFWLGIYGLVTSIILVKFARTVGRTNQLLKASIEVKHWDNPGKNERIETLQRLAKRYSFSISITDEKISPFIVQWPKTHLVISNFTLQSLSDIEFSLMLRHELVHLKRGDGRLTLLMQLVLCFFWFNPVMKVFTRQLMWAIETSCDSTVLSRRSNLRRTYAQAMLKVLRDTATPDANQAVAAFSSKQHRSITMRITHIMSPAAGRIKTWAKNTGLCGFALTTTALAFAFHPAVQAKQNIDLMQMLNPVPEARVTSKFGYRNKFHKFHKGIDLAASIDTPVMAVASGTVVTAAISLKGYENYGTLIVIDHGNGYKSLYSHLNALEVSEGDQIVSGQTIGRVGETGLTTGPHLHLEILKNGKRINPTDFISI